MPDLKSQLQKLNDLKFDDDGEPMQAPVVEPQTAAQGVSAKVFNVVRGNPGLSRKQLLVATNPSRLAA